MIPMGSRAASGTASPRLGLVLANWIPPEEVGAASRAVEVAGFDELWLAEDCFYAGGIAVSSAALAATRQIRVGVGIYSCMLRHPALLAMELSALGRTYPGRFMPGVGLGLSESLARLDLLPPSPLTAVRSTVQILRGLLRGEAVTSSDGPFRFDGVQLAHDCHQSPPPLIVGGMGPRMLRLAGEVGDGVVLSLLAHNRYVEWAVEQVSVGAQRGGVTPPEVSVFMLFSIADARADARADAVRLLAPFLGLLRDTEMVRQLGLSQRVSDWLAQGPDVIASHISDEMLDQFVVWGSPEDCANHVRRLGSAGAQCVALFPSLARTSEAIRLSGERLVPVLLGLH